MEALNIHRKLAFCHLESFRCEDLLLFRLSQIDGKLLSFSKGVFLIRCHKSTVSATRVTASAKHVIYLIILKRNTLKVIVNFNY
jgi:hypothetical protein